MDFFLSEDLALNFMLELEEILGNKGGLDNDWRAKGGLEFLFLFLLRDFALFLNDIKGNL